MRQGIEVVRSDGEQGRHLVDERAGAAGAGAVHPNLHCAVEVEYLRVLAAELNYDVSVRRELLYGEPCGVHLLHEADARCLGHAHSG